MAFIDFLALQEALLLIATAIVAFVGISVYFAMRHNDAASVTAALKAGAVPIGALGAVATVLSVWAETTWPYPSIPGTRMASYNVFFTDIYLLFGLTLVILAVTMAFRLKLAYAGLFAFVAGIITIGYGWNGYILGLTKDPLETFLMYCAFGGTGIFAFPATVMTDHFLAHPDGTAFAFSASSPVARSRPSIQASSRAVQPVIPGTAPESAETTPTLAAKFHLPAYVTAYMWFFLGVVVLAGYSAFAYLLATLPGHLISAP
jgi:putative membrane protein